MRKSFALISLMLLAGTAQAVPVLWTLNNVQVAQYDVDWDSPTAENLQAYIGAASLSGSFVYDADTGELSNVNLQGEFTFNDIHTNYGTEQELVTRQFTFNYNPLSSGSGSNFSFSTTPFNRSYVGAPDPNPVFPDDSYPADWVYDREFFSLTTAADLTNLGGDVDLVSDNLRLDFVPNPDFYVFTPEVWGSAMSFRHISYDFGYSYTDELMVSVQSGSLVGTVIPVPAAVWLFGSALGLLGWRRRRAG